MSPANNAVPGSGLRLEHFAREALDRLPRAVHALPPFNPLWLGVAASRPPLICLEIEGDRICYEVDPHLDTVIVREVRQRWGEGLPSDASTRGDLPCVAPLGTSPKIDP
jgi:hypothetical protein